MSDPFCIHPWWRCLCCLSNTIHSSCAVRTASTILLSITATFPISGYWRYNCRCSAAALSSGAPAARETLWHKELPLPGCCRTRSCHCLWRNNPRFPRHRFLTEPDFRSAAKTVKLAKTAALLEGSGLPGLVRNLVQIRYRSKVVLKNLPEEHRPGQDFHQSKAASAHHPIPE